MCGDLFVTARAFEYSEFLFYKKQQEELKYTAFHGEADAPHSVRLFNLRTFKLRQ